MGAEDVRGLPWSHATEAMTRSHAACARPAPPMVILTIPIFAQVRGTPTARGTTVALRGGTQQQQTGKTLNPATGGGQRGKGVAGYSPQYPGLMRTDSVDTPPSLHECARLDQ